MLDSLVKKCLNIVLDGKANPDSAAKTPRYLRILLGAAVLAAAIGASTLLWLGGIRFRSPILYILSVGLLLGFSAYALRKIWKHLQERGIGQ